MKKAVTVLVLLLLIVGGLGVKAYYDFSANLLKTFATLDRDQQDRLIDLAIATQKKQTVNQGIIVAGDGLTVSPNTQEVPVTTNLIDQENGIIQVGNDKYAYDAKHHSWSIVGVNN